MNLASFATLSRPGSNQRSMKDMETKVTTFNQDLTKETEDIIIYDLFITIACFSVVSVPLVANSYLKKQSQC